jgi:hypothetical protein
MLEDLGKFVYNNYCFLVYTTDEEGEVFNYVRGLCRSLEALFDFVA